MKWYLICASSFWVCLVLALSIGSLSFSVGAAIFFFLFLLGAVVSFFASLFHIGDAWDEARDCVKSAKKDVIDQICEKLGVQSHSYYSYNTVGKIADYMIKHDQEDIEVAVSVPNDWDYLIAVVWVRYEARTLVRNRKKTKRVKPNKEMKLKL